MMRTVLLTLFLVAFSAIVFAQNNTISPPPPNVRTMAEWEETGTLVVSWFSYPTILTEIVKAAHKECRVLVFVKTLNNVSSVKNTLHTAGVDTSKVDVVHKTFNTVWVRDYGPTSVYMNEVDSMLLIDWIYNRNRPADDTLAVQIAQRLHTPLFTTRTAPYDLVNTGGNFMSDGMGLAFASKLILRNNNQIADGEINNSDDTFGTSDHTDESINQIMSEYMGVDRFVKMKELPFDGIHHIDMHMKLLDEETLLVGKYPPNTSDGPQIEANIQYVLDSFKTSFGRDFRVLRVPMPSFNNSYPPYGGSALYPTYANALLVNKTILVPRYDNPLDIAAQDTFKKYMPGYEIVSINCNEMIGAGGAIHCITKELGVPDPLRIVHAAIRAADVDQPADWQVRATVQHRSGIAQAELYFTTDLNAGWTTIPMVWDNNTGHYVVSIPVQPNGTQVYYFIKATANNGKVMARPMPAPEGYWWFNAYQTSAVDMAQVAAISPIYPNPARAITVVPVQMAAATSGSLVLINAQGQVVATIFEGVFSAGDNNYFIHANRYPAGNYQVVLQTAHQQVVQQLVIGD